MLVAATGAAGAAPTEPKGSADVPWAGRYAESHIVTFDASAFDEARFLNRRPAGATRDPADFLPLQGRRTRIVYQAPKGRSSLEVMRNFEHKLEGDGFTAAFGCQAETCGVSAGQLVGLAFGPEVNGTMSFGAGFYRAPRYALFRRSQAGADQAVAIYVGESPSDGPRVAVLALEVKAMQTDRIVVPTATQMRQSLDDRGRIALYGILFDTGQATLKAESQPTLEQIVGLLRANPDLALIVTGHTDSQGDFATNLKLSELRAAAVVGALTRAGVAPSRLTPFGAGMAAPTARNDDEAGRANNRRVELVKR
jgi:outer membrane protein OmpA-like peptidoglycan-associated protein